QAVGAVALARLAAAARLVEAEAAWLIPANLRLGQLGEQRPNFVEQLDVRRRVRARRAADRRLVDVDDLVDVLRSRDAIVRAGLLRVGDVVTVLVAVAVRLAVVLCGP